jgi:hypothetical protein
MADKKVSGWGVIRIKPWHLAGIFSTQIEAVKRMDELGSEYIVRFGDGFTRTGDFLWASTDD